MALGSGETEELTCGVCTVLGGQVHRYSHTPDSALSF